MITITIKSGLRYQYHNMTKQEAIEQFVSEQMDRDIQHAHRNNYECIDLNYESMITEIYEDVKRKITSCT